MRFSDLKVGDHFIFEGREYTKSSPVLATDNEGKSRFIPRSAGLQTNATHHAQPSRVEESDLDRLYQAVNNIIRQEVQDVELETKLRQGIEMAWRDVKKTTKANP